MKKHNNCIVLIRLIAALEVMWGHVSIHLDVDVPVLLDFFARFFNGVPIFLGISGYVIWKSIDNSKKYFDYLKKRFYRIYPELWIGTLCSIAALLFFYGTNVELQELVLYILGQITLFQFWTPESMRGYGCGTPNGSLWTICVLIQWYIIAYWVKKLLKKNLKLWIGTICGSIFIAVFINEYNVFLPEIVTKLIDLTVIPYVWIFVFGAFLSEYSEELLNHLKNKWCYIVISAVIVYSIDFQIFNTIYPILQSILLIMAVVAFAYRFPKLELGFDISYGLYIYHMIVINVFICLGWTSGVNVILGVYIISILLACCSTIVGRKITKAMTVYKS